MSDGELIVADAEAPPAELTARSNAPRRDLGYAILSLPVEQQDVYLAEYWDRRTNFREWLRSKLIEGVHFGYPPGCQPRQGIPEKQWTAKPSLYKSGAEFVCNLLDLRAEYEADVAAWQQMGSKAEVFVFACRLFPRGCAEFVGEGRGVCYVGYKKMDANAVIKMAKKSALVDAVLSAYGLSDLFTQDTEEFDPPPEHDNPAADPDAPKAKPRGERKPQDAPHFRRASNLYVEWVSVRNSEGANFADKAAAKAAWNAWLSKVTGVANLNDPWNWTNEIVAKVEKELGL